ncbi:MAG: hypothetical protein HQ565_00490 [Bacteroidetes bacterium]|nr:hypothetical protein [Bacteroidota bacterium]
MFNKNSVWFGALIGILMPLMLYALLYGALELYHKLAEAPLVFNENMLQLLSPVINLFFIRYYLVTKKYEDTGRGLLLVTFIFVIAYFVIN